MPTANTPGPILRDEMLEARGRTAFPLDRGQTVRVVDVDGQQVADFVCFRRPDTSEKLSVHNTALIQGTIHISTGHLLLSDRCGPLMTITADTCGRHDLLAGSCSEGTNRWRYGVADTPNCRSNFEAALMNVPIGDGKIGIEEPVSRAGDLVDLRAETDLLVAISNCPQERNPCNAYTPTRLRVVVFGPPPA